MVHAYLRRIPRVNLSGAIALGRALLAAADLVPRLSDPVLRAKRLLARRLDNLVALTPNQAPYFHAARSPIALAGRNLDAAWVALYEWLDAIAALPADCGAARSAVEALVGIFPRGFEMIRPPPLVEWGNPRHDSIASSKVASRRRCKRSVEPRLSLPSATHTRRTGERSEIPRVEHGRHEPSSEASTRLRWPSTRT